MPGARSTGKNRLHPAMGLEIYVRAHRNTKIYPNLLGNRWEIFRNRSKSGVPNRSNFHHSQCFLVISGPFSAQFCSENALITSPSGFPNLVVQFIGKNLVWTSKSAISYKKCTFFAQNLEPIFLKNGAQSILNRFAQFFESVPSPLFDPPRFHFTLAQIAVLTDMWLYHFFWTLTVLSPLFLCFGLILVCFCSFFLLYGHPCTGMKMWAKQKPSKWFLMHKHQTWQVLAQTLSIFLGFSQNLVFLKFPVKIWFIFGH